MVAIRMGRPRPGARADRGRRARADAVDRHGDGVLNHAIYAQRPETVAMALDAGAPTEPLRVLFTTRGAHRADEEAHRGGTCEG